MGPVKVCGIHGHRKTLNTIKQQVNDVIKAEMEFYLTFVDACGKDPKATKWLQDNNLEVFLVS